MAWLSWIGSCMNRYQPGGWMPRWAEMELNRSLIPAGSRGRVIAAQTGDNYQSEAGSQSRR